jgi:type I restriction enzyme S subunit
VKAEWKTEPLGELCDFQRGLTYAKSDEVESSDNVVLRATNIDLASNLLDFTELKYISDQVLVPDSKKVKKGSLMICTASGSKSHLGKVAYIDDDYSYAFGGFMGMITPKNALVPRYLFHLMTSPAYKDFISELSDGVNINNLKFDDLKKFPVPHPKTDEQQRIVGILDEAFDGIATAKANAEKNLQNARALFESHLQSVFAEAWQAGDLVTLAALAADITDGDHTPPPKASSGIPFITIGNIAKDTRTIDFTNTFKVPRKYFDGLKPNKKPKTGDVLYTVTGSFGIPVLVSENRDFCFQRHIGLVRPKPEVSSEWLLYLLMSPQVLRQANDGATGTAQKTVSLKLLRSFQVPRVPLALQRAIAAKINAVIKETQRLESIYQQKLAALDALKKSLLHQAFSGQL